MKTETGAYKGSMKFSMKADPKTMSVVNDFYKALFARKVFSSPLYSSISTVVRELSPNHFNMVTRAVNSLLTLDSETDYQFSESSLNVEVTGVLKFKTDSFAEVLMDSCDEDAYKAHDDVQETIKDFLSEEE